ncbi:MAG: ribosome maturation factor RimP [Proteobacteria bacterium]|nr:ribosome maturation factor RimP [Pseudomonadota bacterium]
MTKTPLAERLTGIIGPAVSTLGVELWGIEFASAGSRMVVRVYIDAPQDAAPASLVETLAEAEAEAGEDKTAGRVLPPGVTIAACAQVSRHLGTVLEAEDAVPGAYVLEVSSPGLERRFFNTEQLASYLGRTVDIRLHQAQDTRRHFRGTLAESGPDFLVVDEDGTKTRVAWAHVKIAHLVHEFPGASA